MEFDSFAVRGGGTRNRRRVCEAGRSATRLLGLLAACFGLAACGTKQQSSADKDPRAPNNIGAVRSAIVPDWYRFAWQHRVPVTITNSNTTALQHFQVRISLSATNFSFADVLPDGSDIRVTDADGTSLIPYYISSFDSMGQTGEVWAKVPSIPAAQSSADGGLLNGQTTIYLYYGSTHPGTFLQPPTGMFARSSQSAGNGSAENMVFDDSSHNSATQYYYTVVGATTDGPVVLYRASSPSGPWTSLGFILCPGPSGRPPGVCTSGPAGWDDGEVQAPHLVKFGSMWYLYYSGTTAMNWPNYFGVGVATASSVTGPYTRGSAPILPSACANDSDTSNGCQSKFDRFMAFEPYVFQVASDKYFMIYCGDSGGYMGPRREQLGYAVASSPTGPWMKATENPVLVFDLPPSSDAGTLADPFVFGPVDDWYYLGFAGGDGNGQQGNSQNAPWNIEMARFKVSGSTLTNFEKLGSLLSRGAKGRWDDANTHRGAISLFGSNYYLSYLGNPGSPSTTYWGVASMPALSTPRGFDPLSVFEYYDDFDGTTLDTTRWAHPVQSGEGAGSATVSGGILQLTSGTGTFYTLVGNREFGAGNLIEFNSQHPNADHTGAHAGEAGLALDDRTQNLRLMDYNTSKWQRVSNNGTSQQIVDMAQTADTSWHVHRIALESGSTALFQNDSNAWESQTSDISQRALKPWLFSFATTGAQTTVNIDYFRVRKYAAQEPTASVGAPELAPSAPTPDLLTGLVAHFKLDENGGSTVADSHTPPGASGTTSGTTSVPGKLGLARSFSNAGYINLGTGYPTSGSTLSISVWVNASSDKLNTILHKEGQHTLSWNSGGTVSFADSSLWSYSVFGAYGALTTNTWHHIVVMRNGGLVSLYLDGAAILTRPFGGAISATGSPLLIGCYASSAASCTSANTSVFAGAIDDVAIWNRVLTESEVLALYNAGNGLNF